MIKFCLVEYGTKCPQDEISYIVVISKTNKGHPIRTTTYFCTDHFSIALRQKGSVIWNIQSFITHHKLVKEEVLLSGGRGVGPEF